MALVVATAIESLTTSDINVDTIAAVAIQVVGNHFTFAFDIHRAPTGQRITFRL